jgi:hypothetical protein
MADQTIKQHDTYPPLRMLAAEDELTITASAFGTDTITVPGHGYSNGDILIFPTLEGGAPLVAAAAFYYVVNKAQDTFKVSATSGGAAIDLTTDITAGTVRRLAPLPTADALAVHCKGPAHSISGTVTAIDPPTVIGGQVFNAQHAWAAGETANAELYDVELEVTWDSGATPPAVETFPNGTPPTLLITPDLA